MNILVIGSGGREHALCKKLSESKLVDELYVSLGNVGMKQVASPVELDLNNFEEIYKFIREKNIEIAVVGPEQPLVEGLADFLNERNCKVFGPQKRGAMLEGSKEFSKKFMEKYGIPTASYQSFSNYDAAKAYLQKISYPVVIKASGLAAGKGAVICEDLRFAENTLKEMMVDKIFGRSGDTVVIEDFLVGEEVSIFAITDGKNYKILAPAQDHKAIFDGDKGPNTGGMGAYAPAKLVDQDLMAKIEKEVIKPTIKGLQKENIKYQGVIFFGLMISNKNPFVIEYNVRFGDPETQVILELLDEDLAQIIKDAVEDNLQRDEVLKLKNKSAVCVIAASKGYPGAYKKGYEIKGLEDDENSHIIHAGTKEENGKILTNGGRVLAVVSLENDLEAAINQAYQKMEKINFEGIYYRKDIGRKGLL